MTTVAFPLTEPPVSVPTLRLLTRSVEDVVAEAEAAIEAQDHARARAILADLTIPAAIAPALNVRVLLAQAWAEMTLGDLAAATALLERARNLAEDARCSDADRARVLYGLGACRLQARATGNAAALLSVALQLCERAPDASDRLRAEILERRARAYRMSRDWDAAQHDLEAALELATSVGDARLLAHVYLGASNVAERRSDWRMARFYGEHALACYRESGDRVSIGKVLNNLGAISALLGRHDDAARLLGDALALAEESGNGVDSGYAAASLARLELDAGDFAAAETHARRSLAALAGRRDHAAEAGNAQVVLARALAAQGRREEAAAELGAAERSLETAGSRGHLAAALVAQGDLAADGGDCTAAAAAYKRAAELLQDVHF